MPYQLRKETAHLERTGCQAEIAVAEKRMGHGSLSANSTS
jgi:hypothetical protein